MPIITQFSPKQFKDVLKKVSREKFITTDMKKAITNMGMERYLSTTTISREDAINVLSKLKKKGVISSMVNPVYLIREMDMEKLEVYSSKVLHGCRRQH